MKTIWNQQQQGNVHVSDGAEGYWATFPDGTAATALAEYLRTADYSAAKASFVVRAEVLSGAHAGDVASETVTIYMCPWHAAGHRKSDDCLTADGTEYAGDMCTYVW